MPLCHKNSNISCHIDTPYNDMGVSLISTAIILPILISIMVVVFDLARIYLVHIYAREVVVTSMKFATAIDQQTSIPDVYELVKSPPGIGDQSERMRFWEEQLDPTKSSYHGLDYFTAQELKIFNLAYGFMVDLNPDVAFPIPPDLVSKDQLGGVVNCSVYFTFANLGDPSDTTTNRDRIYYCECAVPLLGLAIFAPLLDYDFVKVVKTAYAYRSGDIAL